VVTCFIINANFTDELAVNSHQFKETTSPKTTFDLQAGDQNVDHVSSAEASTFIV